MYTTEHQCIMPGAFMEHPAFYPNPNPKSQAAKNLNTHARIMHQLEFLLHPRRSTPLRYDLKWGVLRRIPISTPAKVPAIGIVAIHERTNKPTR